MRSIPRMRRESTQRGLLWGLLIVLALGLAWFAFLGIYNRSYADDWCYNADFKELGLSQTLAGYSSTTTYSASRFSLTLFAGLFYPLGIPGLQILTSLIVLALSFGLYRALRLLAQTINLEVLQPILLIAAGLVTFFAIYIAPLRYQSFYWLIGILPYTVPLIFGLWIAVLIGEQSQRDNRPASLLPLLGALAFFGAGFTESGAAFLLTILIFLLALTIFYSRRAEWAQRLLLPTLWSLAWAVLAALILLVSPASWERAGRYGELAGFFEWIGLTLHYSWDFVRFSILDLPLPHFALAATAAFLAFLNPSKFSGRRTWLMVALIVLIAFALIAASYAPSALVEKNPPHPRTRVIARTTMLLAITLIAWLAASPIARHPRIAEWRNPTAMLIGLFSLVYIVRALLISFELQPIYASRAQIWDQRHAVLVQAAEMEQDRVEVQAIDGAPIGGLRDFRMSSSHWVNVCAARVYGVGAISGLP